MSSTRLIFIANSKTIQFLFWLILILGISAKPAYAVLSKDSIQQLRDATYEVVVRKPINDPLKYEKALPLDLIPYAIRSDKYYPVGTAFAIGENKFISAAHVMYLGLDSQYEEVYLRDRGGKIFEIKEFSKYSYRRDFVVFSLKNASTGKSLPTNVKPALNEEVYAVGNALGEGIVIRNGIYTSNTPEERNGDWKWIRFSAAASPGNSGGPLVDKKGTVIGIVLRKSKNENLNYALPISEVMSARNNLAVLDTKLTYLLDNMDMNKTDKFRKEISLPKSYKSLDKTLISNIDSFSKALLSGLLAENKEIIFPRGKGSEILLHKTYSAVFPRLIKKSDDGFWDAFYPSKISDSELGNNGFVSYGSMDSSYFIRIKKPDNISLKKFYTDSKLFMDFILKGIPVTRQVGPQRIKITSLSKAERDYVYIDSYKRKWQVRVWPIPHNDQRIITFALPVPGGYIVMLRAGFTGKTDGQISDLKVLSDFIYLSYYGTLEQWQEFMTLKELLPPVFNKIHMAQKGNELSYKSDRLSFSVKKSVMKISKDSDIELKLSYFRENDKIVWDVTSVVVGEDKNTGTFFEIERNARPPESLSDNYRADWDNIVHHRIPYNGKIFINNKRTFISTVVTQDEKLDKRKHAYTLVYGVDGTVGQETASNKLNEFLETLKVTDE
ncbi:MAG: serine protease [Candidatus Scalindua sp.]